MEIVGLMEALEVRGLPTMVPLALKPVVEEEGLEERPAEEEPEGQSG